jgi:hypothetical protein
MPTYQVTFCTMAEAEDPETAVAMIRQAIGEGHVPAKVQASQYPDGPSLDLKAYSVREVLFYDLRASSAQDAISQVIDDPLDPRFGVSVGDREVIDGPPHWEDEEYDYR